MTEMALADGAEEGGGDDGGGGFQTFAAGAMSSSLISLARHGQRRVSLRSLRWREGVEVRWRSTG